MADITPFLTNERLLLDYMREQGYPVFHNSNMFLRDVEYALRDYFREREHEDIGTRKMVEFAAAFVAALEKRGMLVPQSRNTWILKHETYLLPRQVEDPQPAEASA